MPSHSRHILNCLVQNEPGVLSRVSGILAGRGFNIDSLVVCRTEIRDLSRMSIVISGQDSVVEQARRQLEDLVCFLFPRPLDYPSLTVTRPPPVPPHNLTQVPVWAVLDYTNTHVISRELLLVKVSILGPEYLEDQFVGGPSHEPRRYSPSPQGSKLEKETLLAQTFERSGQPERVSLPSQASGVSSPAQANQHPTTNSHGLPPLTPSEALRLKHQHLQSISTLATQFHAKIVDVSDNSVIVELTAKTSRVNAFLSLLKPFGILESARTGEYPTTLLFCSFLFFFVSTTNPVFDYCSSLRLPCSRTDC